MDRNHLAIGLLLAIQLPAFAACYQADPLVPPTKNLKVLIDQQPPEMNGLGESPIGNRDSSYPPTYTDAQMSLYAQQTMRAEGGSEVSYYEPAPNGGWRVCRIDLWVPKRDSEDRKEMAERTKHYSAGNAFLEGLVNQKRNLAFSTIYGYDAKGRVERIEQADFSERLKMSFKAQHCRRYDEKDNVVLWVHPESSNKCPAGEPSPRDEWRQFKYAIYRGEQVQLLSRWHIPKDHEQWKEEWEPFQIDPTPDSVRGHAHVDSRRGVWEIYGSNFGKRDNNAANMVVDQFGRWNGANYYFPKQTVPTSVLENPDELYKYERRRVTNLDSHTLMVELFKPQEHISRHRIYMTDEYVLRHEQLDETGKVKRVITFNDWRQPRPGPKPDFDDNLLNTNAPRLIGHKIYHRVYDVAANGAPTLVAVSWNPSLRLPLKDAPVSMANLAFGTPDGKVKWKSAEEFYKAFDTGANASQVYPDKQEIDLTAN